MNEGINKKILKNASIIVAVVMVLSSVSAMAVNDSPSDLVLSLADTGHTDYIPQVQQIDPFDEEWIHFDNGENYQGIGLGGGGTFEGAIRITPDELGGYDGWKLITVRWFHFVASDTNPTHSGNIKIYGNGTSIWPGAIVTTEPYTVTGTGWKEILLSHPVTLNAAKDVWVSIEITHGPGEYPLGIDITFAVDGKGDWIYYNGEWSELQDHSSGGPGTLDYNWNIWAKIVGGTDTDPPITTCILDGEMEGDVYVTDVTVTLEAIDYISGVDYTMYNLDDGEWETYEDPFVVSDNGVHTVDFYSVDNVGHIEDEKSCTFTMDKPCYIDIVYIAGGFGVSAIIRNTGEEDITCLEYSIAFDGGFILIPFGGTANGTIDIPAGEEVSVKTFVLGFGETVITVTAECAERASTGTIFFIFVLGVN